MTTDFAKKTSLKIPFQLPEFIRSDDNYQTFVAFIQAYYEWMEQQNIGYDKKGVTYGTQNLLNYQDLNFVEPGETFNEFIDYYVNQFLPNFPVDSLSDKSKLIRVAKELYSKKGTPASYNFLFRALYNSDAELFATRDVVLKASDGKWYVSKSLRLATNDEQWLSTNNFRVFGEASKSFATIERGIAVGNRIEIYVADIERLFVSGEDVVVVDNNNQILYFKDSKVVSQSTTGATPLRAKLLGSISSVNVDSRKRGQLYVGRNSTYSGDPVVFYGGLNSANGLGAKAFVQETTLGSLRDITVVNGSFGYREDPNTFIRITGGGGSGAIANVGSVDPAGQINVSFIPQNYMSLGLFAVIDIGANSYPFFPANTAANISCSLANAFTFVGFETFPISSVLLNNGGGGYSSLPTVRASSLYDTTDPETTENLKVKGRLASLGLLGPIQIVTSGTGYANGDIISFSDSAGGVGARAIVQVNATGSIISTEYIFSNTPTNVVRYPKNGLGYKQNHLPTLQVSSSGGAGAVLRVNTLLGDGADLTPTADERGIGAITSIIVENFGEDYIAAPNVSLKVRDLVVKNVNPSDVIKTGDLIYQGSNVNTAVFKAFVDSIDVLEQDAVQANSKYLLRVYNYTSNTKTNLQLKSTDRSVGANLYLDLDTTYTTINAETEEPIFQSGIRTYGNGAATATARFLNGLITGTGQYINDDGFVSSNQVLESSEYNNFTYNLTVQKSFDAYKDVLFKLLHPAGTRVIPINALKSENQIDVKKETFQSNTHTLGFYTGDPGSNAAMFSTFENTSNNIIKFGSLVGANIANIALPGSLVSLINPNGPNVFSQIMSVDDSSNTVVIRDNVYLSFANVATANVLTSNNRINILSVTDQYDVVNNGQYSNTANKMRDIVFVGDRIRVVNGASTFHGTVTYVEYSNNVIFANTTIPFTSNSANVSIGRTIITSNVEFYNSLGTIYYPELLTQDGREITTQDGRILILG
jgi:hypothetical protein